MSFISGAADARTYYDKLEAAIKAARSDAEALNTRLQGDVALSGMMRRCHDKMVTIQEVLDEIDADPVVTRADVQQYVRDRENNQGIDLDVRFTAMRGAGQTVVVEIRALFTSKSPYTASGANRFEETTYLDAESTDLQAGLVSFVASVTA